MHTHIDTHRLSHTRPRVRTRYQCCQIRKVRRETGGETGRDADDDTSSDKLIPVIREIFDRFDEDRSGSIELAEMLQTVEAIDASAKPEEATTLFHRADANGNGVLDFDEFFASITQPPEAGGLDLRALQRRVRKADVNGTAIGRLGLLVRRRPLIRACCCAPVDQHTRVGVLKRRLTTSAVATFLQVFVMYPGLTNKIFEVFLCRDLGPNFTPGSVMHADYSVDCDETAALRYLGGGALVLLWPIGLPAGLFHAIYQRREKILAGDETTLRTFSFVLGGYKSTHWYWEVSGSAWLLVASVGPGLDLLTDPCDR